MNRPTVEQVSELLDYCPDTGVFRWRVYRSRGARPGDVAGVVNPNGYRVITIGGKKYQAHRLAWLLSEGVWPEDQMDHMNGDRVDNRRVNLREATRAENYQNKAPGKRNTSGFVGVSWNKVLSNWRASICVNRQSTRLGSFDTAEEAAAAYAEAKARLHTFNPTVREA